jgi:hypothetical protein
MTELYSDHLEWTQEGLQLDRLTDMEERDLRPEVQDVKIVPSSSDNGVYLVAQVKVLDKPFEQADITADKTELVCCSCSDWYFNRSVGVETGDTSPSEIGTCKHGRSAYKHLSAQADDSQETL